MLRPKVFDGGLLALRDVLEGAELERGFGRRGLPLISRCLVIGREGHRPLLLLPCFSPRPLPPRACRLRPPVEEAVPHHQLDPPGTGPQVILALVPRLLPRQARRPLPMLRHPTALTVLPCSVEPAEEAGLVSCSLPWVRSSLDHLSRCVETLRQAPLLPILRFRRSCRQPLRPQLLVRLRGHALLEGRAHCGGSLLLELPQTPRIAHSRTRLAAELLHVGEESAQQAICSHVPLNVLS
mmetsp:Transcript_1158/g.2508  ORF Transcript_1158/g.2508 Transcript_1158/m.2508 type:complete len:239 (+) Transcript_1158:285-1001(+)